MPYFISPPPQSPLNRIIATLIAVVALSGAFMIGMVALLFVTGTGLLAGLAIWARITWIRHRLHKRDVDSPVHGNTGHQAPVGEIIDAEYTVISKHEDR